MYLPVNGGDSRELDDLFVARQTNVMEDVYCGGFARWRGRKEH